MPRKPNFLFLITDQHRADYLGCAGHPLVRTPNIDAIAAQGTRFDQFYVATPVCMPNRASLLTGRYPSAHGLRYNGCELSERARTFVELLGGAGYRTAHIGKSHVQHMTTATPEARMPDLLSEAWKDEAGNYDQEDPKQYLSNELYRLKLPYYGYDHVDMVTGHGDQCDGHYAQWLRNNSPLADSWRNPKNQLSHDYICPQAVRTPIPEELYPTSFIKERALEFIKSVADEDQPFFAFVSFPDPHHPFTPPGKYWGMYNPEDFSVPLPYEAHKNPPPHMKWLHGRWKAGKRVDQSPEAFMADEREIREAMALSCGMITMIDDAVGAIIEGLKASGRYDDTVIIFNSDHGDYLGDYNLLLKGAVQLRSINNVPFIWSDPHDRTSRLSSAIASTVDLAPTILARAGISPYFGMQGKNLLDVMDGQGRVRDQLLIEHQDNMVRAGFDEPAMVRTLITDQHRLSIYKGVQWGELYDTERDPSESENLWDDASHQSLRLSLFERMSQEMMAAIDQSPRAKYRA